MVLKQEMFISILHKFQNRDLELGSKLLKASVLVRKTELIGDRYIHRLIDEIDTYID